MGRSVSYPSGAIVAFRDLGDETEDCYECDGKGSIDCGQCEGTGTTQSASNLDDEECPVCDGRGHSTCAICDGSGTLEAYVDWDEEHDYYRDWIKEMFPSFEPCDKWLGREDHALAENRFAYFGLSEYCGLVAIWLKPKTDELEGAFYGDELSLAPLAQAWCERVKERFLKTFGTLRKLGTFSNGEGVYERIAS